MRLVIISFFLSTTFYVTRFLVAISGLSLFYRACGDEGEREREISGNKRIKKYRDRRIREVLSVWQEV